MRNFAVLFVLVGGLCLLAGCTPSSGVSQYYKKPSTTGKTDDGVRKYMKANELENLYQKGGRDML